MAGMMGAQNLGTARGSIEISTAQLGSVSAAVRSVAQQTTSGLGAIDTAVKRTESNFGRLSRGIGAIRGELTGLTLGAGAITGLGLQIAGSFEDAESRLIGMTGGLANAQKLMGDLRKQAAAAGLPFSEMLAVATRLLPTFQGNVKELERWYGVIRRVASLNTTEGLSGAAFSINEALSSGGTDLVSLVERFNISRVKIREGLERNGGDMLKTLDEVLTKMGVTDAVALDLGNNFNASLRVAKDAAMQLLAEGFTPLLQALTPLLQQSAAYLATIRETNPEVVQLGAGLATVAAVGAPALLLFNQLVEAGQKLKALGILGMLGKGGLGIGAALVGGGIGLAGGNAINAARGREQQSIGDVWETAKKLLFIIGAKLNEFAQMLSNVAARVANAFYQMIAGMLNAVANFTRGLATMLPAGMGGNMMNQAAAGMDAMATGTRGLGQMAINQARQFSQQSNAAMLRAAQGLMGGGGAGAGEASGGAQAEKAAVDAQRDIKVKWAQAAAQIERDAAQQRLDATRQYEQQRAQTIAQYEQGIARDAEDFARSRARAATQLAKQIADVGEEAAKREAAWQKDYNEAIADIRGDGNERIVKLEKDYAEDREKAERDHRDRLMSAAARLDAVGVFEEQRRFANQQTDAEKAFDERLTTEKDNLAERLQEEKEAHQERLQEARQADAERIQDMRDSLAEAQALEDEDRAIAAQRRAADFQDQLSQMASAQAERMAQISQQAAQEKAALDESFMAELEAAGVHNEQWLKLQKSKQDASLLLFDEWWKAMGKKFAEQGPQRPSVSTSDVLRTPQAAFPTHFADGGLVRRSGMAMVHAGEVVLNQGQQRAMAGGMARNVTIGDIVVNAAAGMDESMLAMAVRRQIVAALEEAA